MGISNCEYMFEMWQFKNLFWITFKSIFWPKTKRRFLLDFPRDIFDKFRHFAVGDLLIREYMFIIINVAI